MSVYFIPAGIQRTRLNIMQKGTSKIGLKLAPSYNSEVTYVVTELENYEIVVKNLKLTDPSGIKAVVVKALWFFDSLKAGYPLPFSTYVIKPKNVNSENTVKGSIKHRYLCQNRTSLNHQNNKFVTALEILAQAAEMRTGDADNSRALAFRKAAGALKQLPNEINNIDELSEVDDIGQHSLKIVQEIIQTSGSEEITRTETSNWFQTMKLFTGVYGIGPAKANRLYDEGLRTIEDIKCSLTIKLDDRIQHGLLYYEDLSTPILKREAEKIFDIVSVEAQNILPGTVLHLMGGFCRGKKTGHDVDILISHPQEGNEIGLLENLCKRLEKKGLILHQIIEHRRLQMKKGSTIDNFNKCFSILKLACSNSDTNTTIESSTETANRNWTARRVDLIVCPFNELPFAIVGWTGSKLFNRSLRNYAKKEFNMKLTSHYLYDLSTNSHVHVSTEKELFEKLNLTFLKPHERNL